MTKYVVISPCRASVGGVALARGEYFPSSANEEQIERLTKASCLLPESAPEAKRARAEFEQHQAGARQAVEAAERRRTEAAQAEAKRAQAISDEIAAAEKRRDEALASAEDLEAKHAARLAELQAEQTKAEAALADRMEAIAGEVAAAEARATETEGKATDAEIRLQDLEQKIAAAESERAKKSGKKA